MQEDFKLRVSKEIVDIISESRYSHIDKADMIYICHNLISYNDKKSEFKNIIGLTRIGNKLINCKTNRIKTLLNQLQFLGLIVYKNEKKNYVNPSQKVNEAQIDSNFHLTDSWHTFTEENEITRRLYRTLKKKKKSQVKDNLIILPNIEKFKLDSESVKRNPKFLENMELRHLGIDIDSDTNSSSNSRIYNIYSNIKKEYRNELQTVDGNKLFEIDFSSSQFSILVSEMRKSAKKTGTIEFKNELKQLEQIISGNGIYQEFIKVCEDQLEYINKKIAKVLVLKFMFSHPGNRSKNLFSKELSEAAIEENVNLKECWQIINEHFHEHYPNFMKYLNGMCRNQSKDNSNLAKFLQRKEAKILKSIIAKIRRIKSPEFNYFTIHDAIFCSSKFKRNVTKIVHDELNKLNKTEMLTMKYKKVDHNSKTIEIPRNPTFNLCLSHYAGILKKKDLELNCWEMNAENQEMLKMEIDLLQIE